MRAKNLVSTAAAICNCSSVPRGRWTSLTMKRGVGNGKEGKRFLWKRTWRCRSHPALKTQHLRRITACFGPQSSSENSKCCSKPSHFYQTDHMLLLLLYFHPMHVNLVWLVCNIVLHCCWGVTHHAVDLPGKRSLSTRTHLCFCKHRNACLFIETGRFARFRTLPVSYLFSGG